MLLDIVDIITTIEVLEVEVSNWKFGTLIELYIYLAEKPLQYIFYTIVSWFCLHIRYDKCLNNNYVLKHMYENFLHGLRVMARNNNFVFSTNTTMHRQLFGKLPNFRWTYCILYRSDSTKKGVDFRDLDPLSILYVNIGTQRVPEGLTGEIASSAILVENWRFQNPCFGNTCYLVFISETKTDLIWDWNA